MKIVLDTNVLIAAFIAHGACNELLEHCALNHEIVLSPFILDEFRNKLVDKFGFTSREAGGAVRLLKSRCQTVTPPPLDKPTCRDPDDDNVIAAALAAACDCIVSGDRDLLALAKPFGIPIVSPAKFWEFESR